MGHEPSLFGSQWPEADMSIAAEEQVEIVIQVNGKVRDRLQVPAGSDMDQVAEMAQQSEQVHKHIAGKQVRKVITVPDKLVNIVAS